MSLYYFILRNFITEAYLGHGQKINNPPGLNRINYGGMVIRPGGMVIRHRELAL